ncbi:MAG TPA: ATP-binding protein [Thermomicrobiales bacterium]|jgi:serine/threonine-protein kinase RsbT|nr:ATP-binding protein [Thermomicrobiales bacterium]
MHAPGRWRNSIVHAADADQARRAAREIARRVGFDRVDEERVVLAVMELATNLVRYARAGEMVIAAIATETGGGILIESRDAGPGIVDIALALQDGYSTGGGLGGGLPAVRRLMDDFVLTTGPEGTRIETRKWVTRRS